jgi:hypothetical protein
MAVAEYPPIENAPPCLAQSGDHWRFQEFQGVLDWIETLRCPQTERHWFQRWVGFRFRTDDIDGAQESVSHLEEAWQAFIWKLSVNHRVFIAERIRAMLEHGDSMRSSLDYLMPWFPENSGQKLQKFTEDAERAKDSDLVKEVYVQLRTVSQVDREKLRLAAYAVWLELTSLPVPDWLELASNEAGEAEKALFDLEAIISVSKWRARLADTAPKELARSFFRLFDGVEGVELGAFLRNVFKRPRNRSWERESAISRYRCSDEPVPPALGFLKHLLTAFTGFASNYAKRLQGSRTKETRVGSSSDLADFMGSAETLIESSEVEDLDQKVICRRMLAELPKEDADILKYDSIGYSESEIAKILKRSPQEIHNGLPKAYRHAKKWLLNNNYKAEDFFHPSKCEDSDE